MVKIGEQKMKVKDMKFPIEVELKEDGGVYKIKFEKRTWFNYCCDSKYISGCIESVVIPSRKEGFEEKINRKFKHLRFFHLCIICGEIRNEDSYNDEDGFYNKFYPGMVRKAWLKLVDGQSKTVHPSRRRRR